MGKLAYEVENQMKTLRPGLLALSLLLCGSSALAQVTAPVAAPKPATTVVTPPNPDGELVEVEVEKDKIIAVPPMPTNADVATPAGSTATLGRAIAQVVADDLERSGIFKPKGPAGVKSISRAEVTAPDYAHWASGGAEALVQGFVELNNPEEITVGCYLFDVDLKTETFRRGIAVAPRDWRRAAHKCADSIYSKLSGESPFFDSRIAYIAETGPKDRRVKRLAMMDSDGGNHIFLTNGQAMALTPRFSPDYSKILYLSYDARRPRIYVMDVATKKASLVIENTSPTFSPRWSPDGKTILFSMATAGNTDIYSVPATGGAPRRLTNTPGINIGGSFSPDGKKIVFESDRSGGQQIYVMNADGSDQQRISSGNGRYATPEWSPRGDLIAFTKIAGNFRIGVMTPAGGSERILTDSWQDEAPTWSPNGRVIQFFRTQQVSGNATVWQVDLTGVNERRIPTPANGSDPAWGPILP
jgi:TolB protein